MENKNMKVADLKRIIANLPDDMEVAIPEYDDNQPDYYHSVDLAGVIEYNHNKALALYSSKNNSITFRDTLTPDLNVICHEELYPNHYKQLVTLRDYKNAGVFNTMPNGFEIYDYYITDDDDEALLLTHPLFGGMTYLDCNVCAISPDPRDCTLSAFYIDTTDIRIKAGISIKDFIKLIESETKLEESYTDEFLNVMGYKAITSDDNNIYKTKLEKINE